MRRYVHLQDAERTAGQARPEELDARAGDDLRKGPGAVGLVDGWVDDVCRDVEPIFIMAEERGGGG